MGVIRDIKSDLAVETAFEPQVVNTNTTTVGEIIDTLGCEKGIMAVIQGKVTAGDATPKIEECDDIAFGSNVTEVPDENLVGTELEAKISIAQEVSNIGVVGNSKRYLRLSMVSANAANIVLSAAWIKTGLLRPVA